MSLSLALIKNVAYLLEVYDYLLKCLLLLLNFRYFTRLGLAALSYVLSELLHLLVLYNKVFPFEHLNLGLFLAQS